jgi:hypothetical protein
MQETNAPALVAAIIPPRVNDLDLADVETLMHTLVAGSGRPIALEIAAVGATRWLLVRATRPDDLAHVLAQLHARYPQAEVRPLTADDDPLRLGAAETAQLVELRAATPGYLPLRFWKRREIVDHLGADPVLGTLGALASIPGETRCIAQLALVAAPDQWSAPYQRYAQEHPLEPERRREYEHLARDRDRDTLSLGPLILLVALFCGMALLIQVFHLTHRVTVLLQDLIHGRGLVLAPDEIRTLVVWGVVLLAALALLAVLIRWVRKWRATPLYDQRLVQEKTARLAYRARLRLFLISPADAPSPRIGARLSGQWGVVQRRWSQFVAWVVATPKQMAPRRPALWRATPPPIVPDPQVLWARLRRAWCSLWQRGQDQVAQYRTRQQARQHQQAPLFALVGAYRQYHLANGAAFRAVARPMWRARQLAQRQPGIASWWTGWSRGVRSAPMVLSVADVAALWHLPQGIDVPELGGLDRTRARTRPVPLALTHTGIRLGTNMHAGRTHVVRIPPEVFHRHLFAIAKSGKGKSSLLLTLALAAVQDPMQGLCLVDPHGDLIDAFLGLVPDHRRADVRLIDLAETAYPVGLNFLDVVAFPDRDQLVSHLLATFASIWPLAWGPRMESVLEMALKSLYAANVQLLERLGDEARGRQYTLLDIPALLSVSKDDRKRGVTFAGRVRARLKKEPVLRAWWAEQFTSRTVEAIQEIVSPIVTKFNKFSSTQIARHLLGQPASTIDLAAIVRDGQILLLRTARGVVGEDVAGIVGATLVSSMLARIAAQASIPMAERRRMAVYIDEFQTLPGVAWGTRLAELRKYQAHFALVTQSLTYLDRLDRTLLPTILANVDQLFAFGCSAADARLIAPEFDHVVEDTDLVNLDDFTAYGKLTVEGQRLPVFSLRCDPPPVPSTTVAAVLRDRARTYGTPVVEVEQMIKEAQRRHGVLVDADDAALVAPEDDTTEPTDLPSSVRVVPEALLSPALLSPVPVPPPSIPMARQGSPILAAAGESAEEQGEVNL